MSKNLYIILIVFLGLPAAAVFADVVSDYCWATTCQKITLILVPSNKNTILDSIEFLN